jgi:hypothetical protein
MGCKGSKQPPTTPADAKQSLATETAVAAGGQKKTQSFAAVATKPGESSYSLYLMPSDDSLKQARDSSAVFKKVLDKYGELYFKKCCRRVRYPLHITLCDFAGRCDAPAPIGPGPPPHTQKHGHSLVHAAESVATAAGTSPYYIRKDHWMMDPNIHHGYFGDPLYLFKIKESRTLQTKLDELKKHSLCNPKASVKDLHVSIKADQYISNHASDITTMLDKFQWEVCVVEIPHDDKRNALQKREHYPLTGPK